MEANTKTISLAPPGAGVPIVERLAGQVIRRAQLLLYNWDQLLDQFLAETEKITTLSQSINEEPFHRPILINRIRGIEDSSRNWSIDMTLEHLIITMTGMRNIVDELLQERTLNFVVDTAKVKPTGRFQGIKKPDVILEFRTVAEKVQTDLKGRGPGTNPAFRHVHPWFGPLRAVDWVWLIAYHQGIHARQIDRIISKL